MTIDMLINYLTVTALIAFLVAIVYLIVLLSRANKIISKLENIEGTIGGFIKDALPALLNVGTIVSMVQQIVVYIEKFLDHKKVSSKK